MIPLRNLVMKHGQERRFVEKSSLCKGKIIIIIMKNEDGASWMKENDSMTRAHTISPHNILAQYPPFTWPVGYDCSPQSSPATLLLCSKEDRCDQAIESKGDKKLLTAGSSK